MSFSEANFMVILGIDPGTTSVGYALLDAKNPPRMIEAGLFNILAKSGGLRLKELHEEFSRVIRKKRPVAVAIERLFFTKNAKTALAVAEARGVILLTAALEGLNVLEYTPLEVKKVVTGDGHADKMQVKKMVGLLLPEAKGLEARDDVFDALAIALTHYLTKVE